MDLLTNAESADIAALLPEELILEAGGQLQALEPQEQLHLTV
jgi:hypothetical protein